MSFGKKLEEASLVPSMGRVGCAYDNTLSYLSEKIRTLRGRHEEVVVIHGGLRRDERRQAVEAFQDKDVLYMVANDAAGEGINL